MRIAICVPHFGDVKAGFAHCLARLVAFSLTQPATGPGGTVRPNIEIFFRTSSVLPATRSAVLKDAVDWGAEWMLLLDSDHVFPPNALFRLLTRGKPVIGCNYASRRGGGPVVPPSRGVQEVEWLGLGFFLMHRDALDAVAAKATSEGKASAFPLFLIPANESRQGYVGEDIYFCRKLADAGLHIFCDHDLSREIGHVAEQILMIDGVVGEGQGEG